MARLSRPLIPKPSSLKSVITYTKINDSEFKVFLDRKHVGVIRQNSGEWRYFPKGKKIGGEPFATLEACKKSLN